MATYPPKLWILAGLITVGLLAMLTGSSVAGALAFGTQQVPFVGCASDGPKAARGAAGSRNDYH